MSICYIFILGGDFLKYDFHKSPKVTMCYLLKKFIFYSRYEKSPALRCGALFESVTPIYIYRSLLMGIEPILTYARLGRQVHAQVGNPLHRLNHDSAHLLLLGFQQVDDQFVVHLQNYARKDALLVEAA